MAQLDPRLMALLAPQIRAPRIIGMQPLELTPAELGQPPVAAPAAPAPAPSMRGQPRPGAPSPYDGDLLAGTDAPRRDRGGLGAADIASAIGAWASELNGNQGAIASWGASREARRAKEAAIEEAARRRAIVMQAFPDDPIAQIAAEANWEEFGKNLAENFGVDVVAGGSTYLSRGRATVAPKVEQFDDRAGVTTIGPEGPVTQYTEQRGPTRGEETARMTAEANAANAAREVLAPGAVLVDTSPGAPAGDLWSRLVQQESGGDQSAVSPKGAFGVAQLMPDTAAYVARRLGDPSLAERARTDPAVNQRLGQAYLAEQQQRFGNDAVALAAYNAGPEKAAEWVQRFGMPQPGREAEWVARLPYAETRGYVTNILGLGSPRPGTPGPGGARVVAANPKPEGQGGRRMTPEEAEAQGLDPQQPWWLNSEGKPEPIGGLRTGMRPIPAPVAGAITDNRARISQIDEALAQIDRYPEGLGLANALGDTIRQRTDPGGVAVRAAVANIGSMEIKDRSGAAVTAAEQPRLKPFIPQAWDTPEAAREKLRRLKVELERWNQGIVDFYTPEQGYRGVPDQPAAAARARPGPPRPAPRPAAPSGVGSNVRLGAPAARPPAARTPPRPKGVPPEARWDAQRRRWVM